MTYKEKKALEQEMKALEQEYFEVKEKIEHLQYRLNRCALTEKARHQDEIELIRLQKRLRQIKKML